GTGDLFRALWHHDVMKRLNIIGCGRVGRVLGRLWFEAGVCAPGEVLNQGVESAQAAVDFMGTGAAVRSLEDMSAAEVWMIATSDAAIPGAMTGLVHSGLPRAGDIIFHCSGALASSVLRGPGVADSVHVGSLHPVKTFPEAHAALQSFAGTWCAVEGTEEAVAFLREAVRCIGAQSFTIYPADKVLYHAAMVMVCNNLTALMDAGLDLLAHAGVAPDRGAEIIAPIVHETLDNVLRLGPPDALTGPVARGEAALVARQLERLDALDAEQARLYRVLGLRALKLVERRVGPLRGAWLEVRRLLETPAP
ncbi:MAG: Rossmann-like and DUF2520 domain-containing protein, partial [Gammaproteobacteria bacterium]